MTSPYEMELHEVINITSVVENHKSLGRIVRVPGGWLYDLWDNLNKTYSGAVFVPYNEEFCR